MGGKKSKPEPAKDFDKPWRNVDWNSKQLLKSELGQVQLSHSEISHFRIFLHGPVGAGKSCFINSTMSAFKGKMCYKIQEEASAGKSCTKDYKTYKVIDLKSSSIVFNDCMGLEDGAEDGIDPNDIIKAMHGHVKEGHTFNPVSPLKEGDPGYIMDPSPNDKAHCLVSVVPANSISYMDNAVLVKMKNIRKSALQMGIPHVVLMTKIDEVCPLAKNDLSQIYKSRKIKEKMQECSHRLGPPMKFIFPVSNYYEEGETNDKKDVLILMAVKAIVGFIKDSFEDDTN